MIKTRKATFENFLLFQDEEAGEDSSTGLRGGAAEGAEHAAGEGGRLSQRRTQTAERHSEVRLSVMRVSIMVVILRRHVESGQCKIEAGADCSP